MVGYLIKRPLETSAIKWIGTRGEISQSARKEEVVYKFVSVNQIIIIVQSTPNSAYLGS